MEKVNGTILKPRQSKKGEVGEAVARKIAESLLDNLAEIHSLDLKISGLDQIGKPEGYIRRQVEGWIGRYRKSQTDDIAALEQLIEWLPGQMPDKEVVGFIHNDYKLDNIVLNPEKPEEIVAVLDWEMATVGDILMDVGLAMCYWVEPWDHPVIQMFNPYSAFEKNISREEAQKRYEKSYGNELGDLLFYYVFGCFKLAVILQQIYARYVKGQNKNPQVAQFIHMLTAFAENGGPRITFPPHREFSLREKCFFQNAKMII